MEAGAAPPQESGLMFNSWSGKHHQEVTIPLTRRNTNLLQLTTHCLASIIASATLIMELLLLHRDLSIQMIATVVVLWATNLLELSTCCLASVDHCEYSTILITSNALQLLLGTFMCTTAL